MGSRGPNPSEPGTRTCTKLRRSGLVGCVHFRYYLANAAREARKRWVNFALGSFSCLIVVVVAAVCFTILDRAPVILLQEAETKHAQIDMYINANYDQPWSHRYLNFTAMKSLLKGQNDLTYSAPRTDMEATLYNDDCPESMFQNFTSFDGTDWRWLYEGPLVDDDSDGCSNTTTDCLRLLCDGSRFVFTLIDTQQESNCGIGRLWPYGKIPKGQVVLSPGMASTAGLRVGDRFFASLQLPFLPNLAAAHVEKLGLSTNVSTLYNWGMERFMGTVVVPLRVFAIDGNTYGKFGPEDDFQMGLRTDRGNVVILDYEGFIGHVLTYLHPVLEDPEVLSQMAKDTVDIDSAMEEVVPLKMSALLSSAGPIDMNAMITYAVYALPPPRTLAYMDTNFDALQSTLVAWSSRAVYLLGFPSLGLRMPLFEEFGSSQFRALYLGLILSIILTILFILSVMLIYSLLMISIETRTFELGIHRMIGITRRGIIELLITQAFTFSFPAWVIGLIASKIIVTVVMNNLSTSVQIPLPDSLSGTGIMWASILGLGAPVVAAILPIRTALSTNLHDTLDNTRSKTQGVVFSIERARDQGMSYSWLVVGICLSVFGFLIYYLLPLALISFDLSLFFQIFFSLLIGMLMGLILLSLNLEAILERILVWSFLWWEKRAIPTIVLKNLVAHRVRNRKTTIMFALSLSFILFLTVAYKVEMNTALSQSLKTRGQNVVIRNMVDTTTASAVESWLRNFPIVQDYAWVSKAYYGSAQQSFYVSNVGHVFNRRPLLRGVSPNYFDIALEEFYSPSMVDETTGLTVSQQLYTATGSQTSIQSTSFRDYFLADILTPQTLLSVYHPETWEHKRSVYNERHRASSYLDAAGGLALSKFTSGNQDVLVSFATLLRVIDDDSIQSFADIEMKSCLLKLDPQATSRQIDELVQFLRSRVALSVEVYDVREQARVLQSTDVIMEVVFSVATSIAMGLCLFSLMASMYTNIYEQSKEIAILRAIGFTGWTIVRIFVYEAFTLTMAASILGVMIGTVLANTMVGQRALFTQVPTTFQFPYYQLAQTVGVAMVCALVSSFFPALYPARKNISRVMRMVL